MKKPIMHGLDYVRGDGWIPRQYTRKGAERHARHEAAKRLPHGFWTGTVADCGDYWRINIGGGK